MKILFQGSGGREDALLLHALKHGHTCIASPGNAATRLIRKCQTFPYASPKEFAGLFEREKCDLAVCGGEDPLAAGLGDEMEQRGLPFFGFPKRFARAEANKAFFQEVCPDYLVAPGVVFHSYRKASEFLTSHWDPRRPWVVKDIGLCGGKGVFVESELAAAQHRLHGLMLLDGHSVVLQKMLLGREVSLQCLTDKKGQLMLLPPAKDFKRVGENPFGINPRLNTGGMGSVSPCPFLTTSDTNTVVGTHFQPLQSALQENACSPWSAGVLYGGMIKQDPRSAIGMFLRFLECNCRFGDPEIQAVLMRLKSDLMAYLKAAVEGTLGSLPPLDVDPCPAVCLALCTPGYPVSSSDLFREHLGRSLRGLNMADGNPTIRLIFAGVGERDGTLVNAGGRVMYVVARSGSVKGAWEKAYQLVRDGVGFGGEGDVQFRGDLQSAVC